MLCNEAVHFTVRYMIRYGYCQSISGNSLAKNRGWQCIGCRYIQQEDAHVALCGLIPLSRRDGAERHLCPGDVDARGKSRGVCILMSCMYSLKLL